MSGKGDKNRTDDYKSFNKNYDNIKWGRKPRNPRKPKKKDV